MAEPGAAFVLRARMDDTHLDHGPAAGNGPPDPARDLRSLGGYRLLRRLGEGATGSVYLAYHNGSNDPVAVKVLNDQLATNQNYLDRFYREARIGALLDHPNIVRRSDFGQDKATAKHYMVLEYVDGPSARTLLDARGRLSVPDAVHIALSVARALEYAHSRNVVHRDIKPDNILITRSGVSKLADLSLARRTDEVSHLTAARIGFGTTHYMPYEQAINARQADGRSDIYALGATLYHLVTGTVPFPGENHLEVVEKKNHGEFVPAGALNPEVPPALDHILARMLARQPKDRYQTASELIIDLERSQLAAEVPSFADPEKARHDPWLQAMATSGEPTRLDPDAPPHPHAERTDFLWVLRYRNRAGKLCRVRLLTPEVVRRLKAGLLPAVVEARRLGDPKYQPLLAFDEFRDVHPASRPRRKHHLDGRSRRSSRGVAPRSHWPALGVGASIIVFLAAALLAYFALFRS
jgi:serine/threonine-protein kinase